ncbi:iron ABC transporter substrate-binding protein [Natronospirillum operosum]|uniref:Iron ABC transporter substrate-binding protein n=1 Tax=Natronospirillum operosum TaxID=2759953 RepID=A0A4Z0WEP8_9GAMM|nr:iron ABC transporter substrate-binding protein [Natronospirillum operosum]TGG95098.1 iron ABC transporter substrate-binding protein [Natronospirillum operosum]
MYKHLLAATVAATSLWAGTAAAADLTVYSGRGESFVRPIVQQFERDTGLSVDVRYGGTSELAVLLQEEGSRTPADLFWGQDAGAMGALANAGLLATLPEHVYDNLPDIYTSRTGEWVATSGRARVLAYSPERAPETEHPESVFDLVNEEYRGRVSVAPTNGSFQAFVTAMRVEHGDDRTLEWLQALRDNDAQVYRNNTTQVIAIAEGEVDYALVNNYYLPRFTGDNPDYPVRQKFFTSGDIGNMVNVAGIALLDASDNQDAAVQFVEYLLTQSAQQYFTSVVNEYSVRSDVISNPDLTDLSEVLASAPVIDLDDLADLDGTLELLREAGWL